MRWPRWRRGATSAESLTLNAPTAAGEYYYGACADAVAEETNTSNNCSAAVAVKVTEPPRQPDLVVTAASASEAELSPGEAFELTATVGNRGGDASATTLRYYRSADASITAGDAEVGTDAVAALAAGATSAESLTVNAPTAPGTYYYGACADAVAEETNTSNNCSAAVAVKVTEPPRQPDLVVTAASASEAELSPGEAFELTATVGNRGGTGASATTLRYYRSADAAITTSDTQVGTDAVAALAAGATSAESLTVNAPTAPGTYYYGACADAVAEETNTSNNCSAAVAVKVTEPPRQPDLVVTAASASEAELSPGEAFELTATVGNRGGSGASATTLRYYRSTDAAIENSDTQVGTDAVEALAATGSSGESIALTAASASGAYYYGACVDAVPEESDVANNCSMGVGITVAERAPPDLAVTDLVSESSNEKICGKSPVTRIETTVRNAGLGAAPPAALRYFRSTDATVSADDKQVGAADVPALGPAATWRHALEIPSASGTHYHYACVDAGAGETDAGDCSAVVATTVELLPPDFVGVQARIPPDQLQLPPRTLFSLGTSVFNAGDQSARLVVRLYRSEDSTISNDDTLIDSMSHDEVGGNCWRVQGSSVSTPGARGIYYYGGCAGVVEGESDTTNNCTPSVKMTVQ